MSADKTEKATPKKREDARKKGQIARGAELPAALSFLAVLVVFNFLSADFLKRSQYLFANSMTHAADNPNLTAPDIYNLFLEAAKSLAILTLPIMAVALVATLAGTFAQGGLSFSGEALKPTANKFNPAKNIKRIFSADAPVNLVKTLIKLVLLSAVCYGVLAPLVGESATLLNAPIPTIMVRLGEVFYTLGLRIGLVLLALSLADYGYAWYKHEKSLRMTKQEVRDEYKQQEGDPYIKSQRRQVARALTQRRSLTEVPKADVIVTNPTHFAVALKYDREKDAAPKVVAKGADELARKIREIARENNVPLLENPPLARALYKAVEPGQTIPLELFGAVAEVLAYVYRQRGKGV